TRSVTGPPRHAERDGYTTSGRWGPYRQASPSPARHRPGARSARRERCLSLVPQTGFEKESNDVVPSLAGLLEDRFPEPAGPAGPDAAPGTPQVDRGAPGGPLPLVGGRRPPVEPAPPERRQ